MKGTWIAVVGPIGVGKSTLAQIVASRTGAEFVPERFGDNPFLARAEPAAAGPPSGLSAARPRRSGS